MFVLSLYQLVRHTDRLIAFGAPFGYFSYRDPPRWYSVLVVSVGNSVRNVRLMKQVICGLFNLSLQNHLQGTV